MNTSSFNLTIYECFMVIMRIKVLCFKSFCQSLWHGGTLKSCLFESTEEECCCCSPDSLSLPSTMMGMCLTSTAPPPPPPPSSARPYFPAPRPVRLIRRPKPFAAKASIYNFKCSLCMCVHFSLVLDLEFASVTHHMIIRN